jgi:4-amino-4-deoxy-L-arabinose transferase-like glycosyltransferase
MGRRVAIAAAVLAAVYPPLIVYSTAVLSESIFLPLELGAVAAALRAGEANGAGRRWSVAAGAMVGLGLLDRPNSFVLILPLGILVGGQARRVVERVVRPALLVGCALLVVAPWLIRDEVVMHAPVPVSDIDAFNLAGVYNHDSATAPFPYRYQFRPPVAVASMLPLFHDPRLNEVALSDELRSRGLSYVEHHPLAVPDAMLWNTYRLFGLAGRNASLATTTEAGYGENVSNASFIAWFALAALGLLGALSRVSRRVPAAVIGVPVALWLVTVPFLGTARLRNPIEPFVVLLAAAGSVAIGDRLRRRSVRAEREPPSAASPERSTGSIDQTPLVG